LTDRILPATDNAEGHTGQNEDTVPYLAHFDLKAAPFSLLPDPDFLFWSTNHKRAHAMLEYGLMNRSPLTLITGEIGAGKTTLVHQLLRGLGNACRVGLISNASELRGELLYWVLMALGERPERSADPAALFEAFQMCLIDTYAAGRRIVLIFDEAQTLGRERLEALRMLTNINTGSDVLLQIVLVGQPELRATIRAPDMLQFAQRVAASFHLPAMDGETQTRYIEHRLKVAGTERPVFDEASLALIHDKTGGIPRLTNQICDLAMLYAYSADKLSVDPACVQHVLDEGLLLGTCPACPDEPMSKLDRPATKPA
jgi:type II secretory pathway predicted ATPase ExeA